MSSNVDTETQLFTQEQTEQEKQRHLQRIELQTQKGIRHAEEELVKWIEEALQKAEYPKTGKDRLEESQFRNLLRVAETTESPEVIKNFLRYQVGRERKWGRGADSLAERIVQDIDKKLRDAAYKIAHEYKHSNPREVHIQLIRLYLGYGSRRLRYCNLEPEDCKQLKVSKEN